jgi:hypothetical protein
MAGIAHGGGVPRHKKRLTNPRSHFLRSQESDDAGNRHCETSFGNKTQAINLQRKKARRTGTATPTKI